LHCGKARPAQFLVGAGDRAKHYDRQTTQNKNNAFHVPSLSKVYNFGPVQSRSL